MGNLFNLTDLKSRWDLLVTVLLFLCAMGVEQVELFAALEAQATSFRHMLRTDVEFPDDAVVFVAQDEAFFDAYGSYPLRRTDIATVARNLERLGARVVAVDNLFDFPSSYGEDGPTAAILGEMDNVLVVSQGVIDDGALVGINYPVEPIRSAARTGYTNVQSTSQLIEVISRLRIYPQGQDLEDGWPFAVQAVAMYLGVAPRLEDRKLLLGEDLVIPLTRDHDLVVDFPSVGAGASGYVADHGITALDLLDLEDASAEELEELRYWVEDRIVLFGDTSEVSHDLFETPLGTLYGVEFIGATVATLLAGAPLQPAPIAAEVLVAVLMLVVVAATAFMPSPAPRMGLAGGAILLWAVAMTWLYVSADVVFSMSYVLLATVLSLITINARFYLQERGQKALIRDAFGQYLSPKVVNILVRDPSKLTLGGEVREMTAYFSDIAGFSGISEKLTPEELVALLNEYLTRMCDIITGYGGTVDKFEGDAIIAFWGAPLEQPDHARLACMAAIDMQKALVDYRAELEAGGRPILHVRMGLNTGEMLVGNMGSAQRMDYTMMGDAVNLAARLEGANKFYGTYTMISEFTLARVEDLVEVRELDLLRVVGKSEAVRVYELLERKGQLDAHAREVRDRYEAALARYHERDFAGAREGFRSVLELAPDDGPAHTYVARCEAFLETPPPQDWDGVYELTAKG